MADFATPPACLSDEQKVRAYAVQVAAHALAADGTGKRDPIDVVSLATYIATGEDPYAVDEPDTMPAYEGVVPPGVLGRVRVVPPPADDERDGERS